MFDMRAAKAQHMHLPDQASMTLFLNRELQKREPAFKDNWLVVREMRETLMNLLEISAKIELDSDGYAKRGVIYQALLQANFIHACHDAVGINNRPQKVYGHAASRSQRRLVFDDVC